MEEDVKYSDHEIEKAFLKWLNKGRIDCKLGTNKNSLLIRFRDHNEDYKAIKHLRIVQAFWRLLARNLIYLDIVGSPESFGNANTPELWHVLLTPQGEANAEAREYAPESPADYLALFIEDVPRADEYTITYVRESLESFKNQCHFASAVMLGVAAEASFLKVAHDLASWAGAPTNKRLMKLLANRQSPYSSVIREVRALIDQHAQKIPGDLLDGIGVQVMAIAELIRAFRNDAGHPTGKKVEREQCYAMLVVFPFAIKHMHRLMEFFLSDVTAT